MLRLEVQILSSAPVLKDFYKSEEYRKRQSVLMKLNWQKGIFDFHLLLQGRFASKIKNWEFS